MFAFFLKAIEFRRKVELTTMKLRDEAHEDAASAAAGGKRKRVEG